MQSTEGPIGFSEDENLFPKDDPYDWKESNYAEWEKEDEEKRRNEKPGYDFIESDSELLIEGKAEDEQNNEAEVIESITTTRNNALYTYIENFRGEQADEQSLLGFCNYYRGETELDDDSVVIVLTSKKSLAKIQSYYDANNNIVMVLPDGIKDKAQIIEAIIQFFLKHTYTKSEPKVRKTKSGKVGKPTKSVKTKKKILEHDDLTGCINDKLTEADVKLIVKVNDKYCDACVTAMINSNVHPRAIDQGEIIVKNAENIKLSNTELKDKLKNNLESNIILLERNKIYFESPKILVEMKPQEKALYIFFLIAYDGKPLEINSIQKYQKQFADIYAICRSDKNEPESKLPIENLFLNKTRTEKVRNSVNNILYKSFKLNQKMVETYGILGSPIKGFKVCVKKECIKVNREDLREIVDCKNIQFIGKKRNY